MNNRRLIEICLDSCFQGRCFKNKTVEIFLKRVLVPYLHVTLKKFNFQMFLLKFSICLDLNKKNLDLKKSSSLTILKQDANNNTQQQNVRATRSYAKVYTKRCMAVDIEAHKLWHVHI